MLLLCSETLDPCFNLATEQWLQEQAGWPPVFFVYRNAPSIIVGKYQNVYAEADVPAAQRDGVPVVRRSSGGGTVYHDEGNFNLCFAEAVPAGEELSHDRYVLPVAQALRALGIPAEKSRSCDLTVEGRKCSGSAQCVRGGRTLHHCTLLFDTDLAALRRYLRADPALRGRAVASVPSEVADLRPYHPVGREQFLRELIAALFPQGVTALDLTAEQTAQIEALAQSRYRTWEWNYGASPAFTATARDGATLRVTHGIVSESDRPQLIGLRYDEILRKEETV